MSVCFRVGHFVPAVKLMYMLYMCIWNCYRLWNNSICIDESSLTYIPAVNGYKHIDDPLKGQQPDTQNQQRLQPHTSPGPHVWHQQTHFPPEALPCWPRDHLHLAWAVMLLMDREEKEHSQHTKTCRCDRTFKQAYWERLCKNWSDSNKRTEKDCV